jgi:hypothetical protein
VLSSLAGYTVMLAALTLPVIGATAQASGRRRLAIGRCRDIFCSRSNKTLLTMQTAVCYREAGQPLRAVELYQRSLSCGTFSLRDRGYFLSLMAGDLAQVGEPDTACEVSQKATIIAVEMRSQRTMHELRRVLETLTAWRRRLSVRALTDALRSAGLHVP